MGGEEAPVGGWSDLFESGWEGGEGMGMGMAKKAPSKKKPKAKGKKK